MHLPRHARAGFTLVEVLVTLMILALLMVGVLQVLNRARAVRDTVQNIQELELAGPMILQQIDGDLRALTIFDRDPREAMRVRNRMIAGFEADSLDFVATTDGMVPFRARDGLPYVRADINEVGYVLRPNPDHDDFLELYRREDFGVDDEPFEGGRYALLHDRVKGFEIRLYREDGIEAEPEEEWGGDTDEFTGLPARLEIELTLELAPRLVREQLVSTHSTMTYKLVYRFPANLAVAQEVGAVPLVPSISRPVANTQGPGGADAAEGGGGGGGGGGPGEGGNGQEIEFGGDGAQGAGAGGGGGGPPR